ncbi:MAG: hypothetical protein EOP47_28615, partial [Sphingobacteriaceae bacterium]
MSTAIKSVCYLLAAGLLAGGMQGCKKSGRPVEKGNEEQEIITVALDKRLADKVFPSSPTGADGTSGFVYDDKITTFDNTRWYPK